MQTVAYQRVLACSDVHYYLSVPFVLCWSLLEAMASGCCIVASDTPPVREVLSHGESAVLVDFFSPEQQASAVNELLTSKQKRRSLSDAAREASKAYDSKKGLEAWMALMSVNSNQTAQRPGSSTDVGVYILCRMPELCGTRRPHGGCGCEETINSPTTALFLMTSSYNSITGTDSANTLIGSTEQIPFPPFRAMTLSWGLRAMTLLIWDLVMIP